ncbi:MAG: hypothetical protein LC128_11670 [Chitinophagales bacterium]|nr:hypothetical protein [Chitinophagales bacterium]
MKKIITLAATILIFSCNNSGNNTTKTSGSENSTTPETSNPGETMSSGSSGSDISVTLTGGANAGTYHVTSNETTCSEGLTGDNSFGNQYSENGKADNELSSLQLIIDDKNAAKTGASKFSISIGFGKLLNGKTYNISTQDNNSGFKQVGSGKATYTENGGIKTVVVEGKTSDGVGISATIICNKIMTANGIQ